VAVEGEDDVVEFGCGYDGRGGGGIIVVAVKLLSDLL
jgi:hypothetical protein